MDFVEHFKTCIWETGDYANDILAIKITEIDQLETDINNFTLIIDPDAHE